VVQARAAVTNAPTAPVVPTATATATARTPAQSRFRETWSRTRPSSPGLSARLDAPGINPTPEPEFARFADWTRRYLAATRRSAPRWKPRGSVSPVNDARPCAVSSKPIPPALSPWRFPQASRGGLPDSITSLLEDRVSGRGHSTFSQLSPSPGGNAKSRRSSALPLSRITNMRLSCTDGASGNRPGETSLSTASPWTTCLPSMKARCACSNRRRRLPWTGVSPNPSAAFQAPHPPSPVRTGRRCGGPAGVPLQPQAHVTRLIKLTGRKWPGHRRGRR